MNETAPKPSKKKMITALVVLGAVVIIGGIILFFYLEYKSTHISTDDAFIEGHIHTIASKVPGTVKEIYIKDNQQVKKGDLLLVLSPLDYEVKVREASADLQAQKKKMSELQARLDAGRKKLAEQQAAAAAAKANLELQQANFRQAERDITRAEDLFRKEAISRERYEQTLTRSEVAAAQVKAAKDELTRAASAVQTQKANVQEIEAAMRTQGSEIERRGAMLSAAELNASYTSIYAPSDGAITKKTVELGNQIQPGQALMAVVDLDNLWVVANYKETQLKKVKPGQKVDIKVDTFPNKTFHGRVDSIMAGTGAVFTLFPPENATGNYVKVVQRIPVKMVFDKDTDPEHILRVGMSVEPTINVE